MRSLNIPQSPAEAPAPAGKPARDDDPYELEGLDVEDLIRLRQEVDKRLPLQSLRDLNMEKELLLQLLTAQQLQRDVLADQDVPANQRAQTVNAVAAALSTIAKLQVEVHTSERLKKIEQVLIDTLQTLPLEAQERFLEGYETTLEDAGL